MKNIIVVFSAIPLFLASFSGAGAGSGSGTGAGAVNSPVGTGISLNWSGYAAASGTYTGVGASWVVPQAAAGSGTISADATWVGIGGVASNDLIQAGTQAIFQNGTTSYEAWYETLPGNSTAVPLAIHPGDAVTVSLDQISAGEWQAVIADGTTGQSYTASVAYASALSSAEWVEEMPSDARGFVPLDNFGSVPFTNGFAVMDGNRVTVAGAGATALTMENNAGGVLSAPTPLGADGASFTVTRGSAAAAGGTQTHHHHHRSNSHSHSRSRGADSEMRSVRD